MSTPRRALCPTAPQRIWGTQASYSQPGIPLHRQQSGSANLLERCKLGHPFLHLTFILSPTTAMQREARAKFKVIRNLAIFAWENRIDRPPAWRQLDITRLNHQVLLPAISFLIPKSPC